MLDPIKGACCPQRGDISENGKQSIKQDHELKDCQQELEKVLGEILSPQKMLSLVQNLSTRKCLSPNPHIANFQ